MAVAVYESMDLNDVRKLQDQGPFIALTHGEAEIAIKAIYTVRRAVDASAVDESLRSEGDHELQMSLEHFYENADV